MRVLLIDDHIVFTQGLKFLLSDLDESIEFLDAPSSERALEFSHEKNIDLILLDFHMPGLDGLDALTTIKEAFNSSVIVMLSSEDNPNLIRESIDNGASGFIPKSSTAEVLIAALRLILAGGIYLPADALHSVRDEHAARVAPGTTQPGTSIDSMSSRELGVFMGVVQGKPNNVVAREMDITEDAVTAELSSAYRALGVHNRTEAVFIAAKLGLTRPGANGVE